MTIEERIKEDAKENARGWLEVQQKCAKDSYLRGAKSERNKTIDEAIDIVTDYQDYNPLIIERLKAMKI